MVLFTSSSHTRNERRVQELTPVLGSQPAGDPSHKPGGIGCHYFSSGPRLPVQPPSNGEHHRPLVGTKLYCLVTEADVCKQHAPGCTFIEDQISGTRKIFFFSEYGDPVRLISRNLPKSGRGCDVLGAPDDDDDDDDDVDAVQRSRRS